MPTTPAFAQLAAPVSGDPITLVDGRLSVPDVPVIPFIVGDGTGPDIWRASQYVLDAAVARAYGGKRRLAWFEVFAGEKSKDRFDSWLPDDTLAAINHYLVAIKGPLTTPVGGGFRSLNVALRQQLDLYACVRPVRWFTGVPSPVKDPGAVDMVIFRENTEDIYAGIEYESESEQARKLGKGRCNGHPSIIAHGCHGGSRAYHCGNGRRHCSTTALPPAQRHGPSCPWHRSPGSGSRGPLRQCSGPVGGRALRAQRPPPGAARRSRVAGTK